MNATQNQVCREKLLAQIFPASPHSIRAHSYGIVRTSRLLDFRKRRFSNEGLFSEQIFGPVQSFHCGCGKYSGKNIGEMVCDVCGVLVTSNERRNTTFGHIEFELPALHPWWYGNARRAIETLTTLSTRQIQAILQRNVAIDFESYERIRLIRLIDQKHNSMSQQYPAIRLSGAEAIEHLLSWVAVESPDIRIDNICIFDRLNHRQRRRRIRLLDRFRHNDINPQDLVLQALPVIPPALRWIDLNAEGRLVVDPVTRCYQRIVGLNRAIGYLKGDWPVADANPDAQARIVGLEKKMRQNVSRLFSILLSRAGSPARRSEDWHRKSQTTGRSQVTSSFRRAAAPMNVIPDPAIPIDECRVPLETDRQLWPNHPYSERPRPPDHLAILPRALIRRAGLSNDQLRPMFEGQPTLVKFPRAQRSSQPPPMLSLNRRSTTCSAVHVHPLLATWFELSFESQQAMVWQPSQWSSIDDLKRLELAAAPWMPSDGQLTWKLVGDALLGCYLATTEPDSQRSMRNFRQFEGRGLVESELKCISTDEVRMAMELGKCDWQTPLWLKLPAEKSIVGLDEIINSPLSKEKSSPLFTTAGRVLFNAVLPDSSPFYDLVVDAGNSDRIINAAVQQHSPEITLQMIQQMARFGWEWMTRAGLSLAACDLRPPTTKFKHVVQASKEVEKTKKHYLRGVINTSESNQKQNDIWWNVKEDVIRDMVSELNAQLDHPFGAIRWVIPNSHQRKVKEINCMIGPVGQTNYSNPTVPIVGSYAEGLSVHDYFRDACRAREQRIGSQRKQTEARRLTRRLASASRNVVVTETDCGTSQGVIKRAPGNCDHRIPPFDQQILGRFSCETVIDPCTEEIIANDSTLINAEIAAKLSALGLDQLEVRSPTTCQSTTGICQRCYGGDLRTGELVERGTTIGTISALTIGSSLTSLKEFIVNTGWLKFGHHGENQDSAMATHGGTVSLASIGLAVNSSGDRIALSDGVINIVDRKQRIVAAHPVRQGAVILVAAGEQVSRGQQLAKWSPYAIGVYAKSPGVVAFSDLEPGRNMQLEDNSRQPRVWTVIFRDDNKHPCIRINDIAGQTVDFCYLWKHSRIFVVPGQAVDRGTKLAELPVSTEPVKDWAVGPIHFEQTLRAADSKSKAVLAEVDGTVTRIEKNIDRQNTIWIRPDHAVSDAAEMAHCVDWTHSSSYFRCREHDRVQAGAPLTGGPVSVRDLLRILGPTATGEHLLQELQMCFRAAKVDLDDRHLELFVRQMLGHARVATIGDTELQLGDVLPRAEILESNGRLRDFRKIDDPGDSNYLTETVVARDDLEAERDRIRQLHGTPPTSSIPWPASFEPMVLGIDEFARTHDSLLTATGFTLGRQVVQNSILTCREHEMTNLKDCFLAGGLLPAGSGWRES